MILDGSLGCQAQAWPKSFSPFLLFSFFCSCFSFLSIFLRMTSRKSAKKKQFVGQKDDPNRVITEGHKPRFRHKCPSEVLFSFVLPVFRFIFLHSVNVSGSITLSTSGLTTNHFSRAGWRGGPRTANFAQMNSDLGFFTEKLSRSFNSSFPNIWTPRGARHPPR